MPRRKKITWLLVGDGAKAKLYFVNAIPLRIKPVPGGGFRVRNAVKGSLEPVRPTRSSDSVARPSIERNVDAHQRRENKFVARVAAAVNRGAADDKFDNLILVAPPRALAAFRKNLDAGAHGKIKREVPSEWTKLGVREIERHLEARLGK